jgi:hypothetical protein
MCVEHFGMDFSLREKVRAGFLFRMENSRSLVIAERGKHFYFHSFSETSAVDMFSHKKQDTFLYFLTVQEFLFKKKIKVISLKLLL